MSAWALRAAATAGLVVLLGAGFVVSSPGAAGANRTGTTSTDTSQTTSTSHTSTTSVKPVRPTRPSGKREPRPRIGALTTLATSMGLSLKAVIGTVYPAPFCCGVFDNSQLASPQFSQKFKDLFFNPDASTQGCRNAGVLGSDHNSRPFDALVPSPS